MTGPATPSDPANPPPGEPPAATPSDPANPPPGEPPAAARPAGRRPAASPSAGGPSPRTRRPGEAPAAAPITGDIVRARPVRLRRVAALIAVVVTVTFVVIAVLLGNSSSEGVSFGIGDQIAMVLLGLFVAGGILLIARPSLVADQRGLRVRNILVSHDVPWEIVRAVSFPAGSPWATLELADDDQLALLAVQASDGERSVAAVRALRALQARHAAAGGRPGGR